MSTSSSSALAEDDESSSSSSSITSTSTSANASKQQLMDNASGLASMSNDFRAALDEFRGHWQRELQSKGNENVEETKCSEDDHLDVDAKQQLLAETLFQKAVQLEQRGKVYDALPFYRKAVQIVPDIELKFYERHNPVVDVNGAKKSDGPILIKNRNINYSRQSIEEEFVGNLYEKFQLDLVNDYDGKLLLRNSDSSVVATAKHVSDLPTEILFYILRWVVSSHLDMRSLEQCSAVCKGLFICARDEKLWRLACLKIWGKQLGTIGTDVSSTEYGKMNTQTKEAETKIVYNSWRQMFIEREHVHFNGCYISKTTYLRMGENSFQDQFYRPVQLVEYFRYIRFLPDGTVLMMTNADEPMQGVNKLKNLHQLHQDILRGQYRLSGNIITIALKKFKRQNSLHLQQYPRRQRRGCNFNEDVARTCYCIEFRMMQSPKRRFNHLVWQHYSIKQVRNKVEVSSEFELTPSKYPPLWFSPVRSYHLIADAPLN